MCIPTMSILCIATIYTMSHWEIKIERRKAIYKKDAGNIRPANKRQKIKQKIVFTTGLKILEAVVWLLIDL